MNEDVIPIEHGDFPMSCDFSGVYCEIYLNDFGIVDIQKLIFID